MSYFVVDVESDGPCPGLYSMVCFGVVLVDDKVETMKSFYGQVRPISEIWKPDALAVSGFTREQCLQFPCAEDTMKEFAEWVVSNNKGRPIFISDNNGFDWSFINYYLHTFYGDNPFGWSSRRIGDLYCGMQKSVFERWKHLRKTKHTHNPVDDAMGNAEALIELKRMGLVIDI